MLYRSRHRVAMGDGSRCVRLAQAQTFAQSYKIYRRSMDFTVLPVSSQFVVSASMSAISCVSDLTGIVISAIRSSLPGSLRQLTSFPICP